ncbi:ABC transporter permease [Paenibacillus spongiae]|uniref:ABC transporter permease n=1 Tax=Paenibacillus spongiae TaxID=2909671 RepID=A0ABY5S4M4_9BACL|nr:ABC transporter permease [Paenibacillus spongiae]UVI28851.1 ABC transporter permease [Paenibacillus spongiae]
MEPITKRAGGAIWTGGKLFRRRLSRRWLEQWRVWRTVLDWSVWIYIVIPALWIGGGMYAELWTDPAPWMNRVPLWATQLAALLIVNTGTLRTFAEEADVLFLLQKPDWSRGLFIRGMAYTALGRGIAAALFFAFILPIMVIAHDLAWITILEMFLLTWLWSVIGSLWHNLLEGRYRGWRRTAWKLAAMLMLSATYIVSALLYTPEGIHSVWQPAAGLIALAFLIAKKLRARDTFESDVQQEHRARLASTELLLGPIMERKPRIKMNKPIVMRSSKRIFRSFEPAALLAENTIKSFLRRFSQIRIWLGYLSVSTTAMLLSPLWVKILLMVLLPLLIARWVQSLCENFIQEPFIEQFNWTDSMMKQSAQQVRLWLVLPIAVVLGLAGGVQMFGVGGLLGGAIAGLYWWKANEVMSDVLMLKQRKKGKS